MMYTGTPGTNSQGLPTERRRKPRTDTRPPIAQEMESERSVLRAWQSRLRTLPPCEQPSGTGGVCTHARNGGCMRQVLRLSEDMLFYLSEHFGYEDEVMHRGLKRGESNEAFDLHREDHGTIMHELIRWLGDATPCRQRHAIHALLHGRFATHLETHDEALQRML